MGTARHGELLSYIHEEIQVSLIMSSPALSPIPPATSGKDALSVAAEACRRAGQLLVEHFLSEKEVTFKGRGNVVTDLDKVAEKAILDMLKEEYPDFSILSEESEPVVTASPYTWIIDPLDGSRNYASGVPHFSVVAALARKGTILLGVTYDPVREEMFTAEVSKGAYLNGVAISVSAHRQLLQCLLGLDMGYEEEGGTRALEMARTLWPGVQGIRIMGSGALGLAYAACGRIDIYSHHSLYPWDIASGLLLVSEAGGIVVDHTGSPAMLESPSVIASSTHLVDLFLAATEGLE